LARLVIVCPDMENILPPVLYTILAIVRRLLDVLG
jgi:hypothetical protein